MGQKFKDDDEFSGVELFVRAAADVTIEDGLTTWRLSSGDRTFILRASPAVLLESIRRSTNAYNAWVTECGGTVVELHKGKRKKRRGKH